MITGETGAGKSIILGAIGLLLGQRADVKSIRRGAAKCVIEARFEIAGYGMQPFFEENELEYEDECILRREVYASGKSRAFINDTPASLVQMKELGEQLIDVHSQHQNLLLNKEGFQLKLDVAQKESCVDFAFWGGLTPNCVQNMEELNRLGCVAYKGFMSFANPDYPQVTDGYLVQGMRKAATFNGLIGVHAENAEVADFGSKEMSAIHCKDFAMHDDARPWWVEQEAISRAVLFARETGARLYICHMTIAQGAAFLKQAKFEGVNVSVETCPHYLLFDKTILRERGAYAKCNPPFAAVKM